MRSMSVSQRRRSGPAELAGYLLAACGVAGGAALVGAYVAVAAARHYGLGCRPAGGDGGRLCPDGVAYAIPALTVFAAVFLLVVTGATILIGRRVDAVTLARMSRIAMWLVPAATSALALAWLAVALGSGSLGPLWSLPVVVFTALPIATAYLRPRWTAWVLGCCLGIASVVALLGYWLVLLLPVAVGVVGAWAMALVLWCWSTRPDHPAQRADRPD